MSALLEGDERLEQELTGERIVAPATRSLLLHLALAVSVYFSFHGFFHGDTWGGNTNGGTIRASIVSTIPLPSDQPPNENVLSTETPSPAPAPPAPKTETTVDQNAIPIQGKHQQPKPQPRKQQKLPPQPPTNRAQYGEQAANNLPRAIQGQNTPGASVTQGDFGSKFPWYVDGINRKMSQVWNKFEVDQRTPKGARVFITFSVRRDGTPSNVQLDRSSGSPTLDRSCLRAAQRVDTFGNLPGAYSGNNLNVSYYCEY